MKQEIERKFLVDVGSIPAEARAHGTHYAQGYLADKPTVRVRLASGADGSPVGYLTIKGPGTIARSEFEYEIPAEDARALLQLCSASLTKVRYRVPHEGHVWELDQFEGPHEGLWLAELELSSEDESFARPPWLRDEVSHDPRYSNGALARAGRAP